MTLKKMRPSGLRAITFFKGQRHADPLMRHDPGASDTRTTVLDPVAPIDVVYVQLQLRTLTYTL